MRSPDVPIAFSAVLRRTLVALLCIALHFLVLPTILSGEAAAPVAVGADKPECFQLWPEGVPGLHADAAPERIENDRVVGVHYPTLTHFAPMAGKANGTAVVYCPGGGYVRLGIAAKGSGEVRNLVALGVHVFVLTYRLSDYGHPAPLQDVLRAIRLVRSRACDYGIRPDRIGVMGGSAGGHLSLTAATLWDSPLGLTGHALDTVSARPDFVAAIYPVVTMTEPHAHKGSRKALFGTQPTVENIEALSLEKHVRKDMPKVFLAATMADKSVPVENSLMLFKALRDAGVPTELHVYSEGSHGNSLDPKYGPTALWPERLHEWLAFIGMLPSATPPPPKLP